MMKKAFLLLLLTALFAGCADDGKTGAQGPKGDPGSTGDPGPKGEPGDSASGAKPLALTILHMNDHHSHIAAETFDFDVSQLGLTQGDGSALDEVSVTYGGFPMLVNVFRTLEQQQTNVLKLHAGDAITGTLYYSLFKGQADAAVMNQVCFDAFALGNHEFDDGDAGLANFLDALNASSCKTPALAANIQPAEDSAIAEGYIQPYLIKEFDGQKVGIIGIDIASKTKNSSNPDDGTVFLDETETAQANIDALTAMGINKIILMTHYQYANDLTLAANLTGVDVIVGGDSHTLLGGETFSSLGFNPAGDYPTQVTDSAGKPVCIVQAWEYAHLLGMLKVSFDEAGDVTECAGQPVMPISDRYVYEDGAGDSQVLPTSDGFLVTQALTAYPELVLAREDATTGQLVATYDEQVDVLKETVIGAATDVLCLERFPGQGRSSNCDNSATYARGSDISNIVAKAFLRVTPTADIGIQNGGGVRVDITAGDYTIADAFTLLPFANTLVTLEMTGAEIIATLEDALDYGLAPNGSSGAYPYASGLRYDVDASQAKGARFSNVQVNSRLAGDWAAIDNSATYTVVTNNFIASGQDGYTTFGEVFNAGRVTDTYTEYAQGFIDYVEQLTQANQTLQKLPVAEYSTQSYIDSAGCDHAQDDTCAQNDAL
ncbi:MAG TPA: 5'-nucleotidase C-terminal domain-containing protein [Marinagarivorans sp.]